MGIDPDRQPRSLLRINPIRPKFQLLRRVIRGRLPNGSRSASSSGLIEIKQKQQRYEQAKAELEEILETEMEKIIETVKPRSKDSAACRGFLDTMVCDGRRW